MTARQQHADWLHTFRALQAYTSDFSEPLQGKPDEWFLSGPLLLKGMIKNAVWAKALIPKKYQARVVPGTEYAKAFSYYQEQAQKAQRLNHEPMREILKEYEPIIQNLQK